MGSCCSKAVVFTQDIANDLKWKYENVSFSLPSGGCLCWKKNRSISQRIEENSQFSQTEEVVFKLIQTPNMQLKLLDRAKNQSSPRERNWSTETTNSRVSLSSARRKRSSSGFARSLEEILMMIERLQSICSRATLADQVSLLCTIGYLREYCILLNDEKLRQDKLSDASAIENLDADGSQSARFWVSAFNYNSNDKERGIKRFKKMAMAVRTAIAIASLTRSSITSSSSATDLRSPITLTDESSQFLEKNLLSWNFDQFLFDKLTNNHGISILFPEILKATNLMSEFKIHRGKLKKFCLEVEKGYQLHNNPYHNERHGADVLQTTYFLVVTTKVCYQYHYSLSQNSHQKYFLDLLQLKTTS